MLCVPPLAHVWRNSPFHGCLRAVGEYVCNLFDNGRDTHFFMSPDRINALECMHVTRDTEYDAVLGCQDRFVTVVCSAARLFRGGLSAN